LLFGVWQFALGQFRGRVPREIVLLACSGASAVVYLLLGVVGSELILDAADISRGLAGGLLNVGGTLLVLKAYETGKIGVVTGVAATSALVPLAYSFLMGETLSTLAAAGLVVVIAGLAVFYVPSARKHAPSAGRPVTGGVDGAPSNSVQAILLALLAAGLWGLAIVALDLGTRVSVTGTMLVSQVPQIVVTLVIALAIKKLRIRLTGRSLAITVGAGLALALGQVSFFTAANEGNIGVVSILASLSPLVTALLALVLLKEKMARLETVALLVVVVGTCLVAA
jgi:drug/metabolite transporter (DMT)-like permease